MKVIESDRTTFFDCDDTLIMWDAHPNYQLPTVEINGRTFGIHYKHVQKIKDYHVMGFKVFVWSNSGYKWAETIVKALHLEEYVDFVLCKPHRVFDDVKDLNETIGSGYIPL